SKEFCTERQRQYVQTMELKGPYTPQVIINGRHDIPGSRRGWIKGTIADDLKEIRISKIGLALSDNQLNISLPQIDKGTYQVLLFPFGYNHAEMIKAGENEGKLLQYTNPVENIIPLGSWNGKAKSLSYNVKDYTDAHGFAVIVHNFSLTGSIVAASQIKR
ncbi:MAG TPA: DUF1223 domain-containing protein, partial [Alphaproteobacteria bacterium]|nr:DUF1223 domain-containing protein [Alphaproteobacteria bacterium]